MWGRMMTTCAAKRNWTVRLMSGYAWHDLVGNLGVLMILGSYFALQVGRIDAKSVGYSALNALGAGSITVSLLFDFNLSAFVVEAAWVAVSVYGLARALRRVETP
jgi:paired small multidrug resistance pump